MKFLLNSCYNRVTNKKKAKNVPIILLSVLTQVKNMKTTHTLSYSVFYKNHSPILQAKDSGIEKKQKFDSNQSIKKSIPWERYLTVRKSSNKGCKGIKPQSLIRLLCANERLGF